MLILLNRNLSPYCVIGGETEGNVLLREKQYFEKYDLPRSIDLTQNKIANQITLLQSIRKKTKDEKELIRKLKIFEEKTGLAKDIKQLLGIEGNASKIFFKQYFGKHGWIGRKPRTKFDEINTLLDIGYTLLFNFIEAHLRLYGFDIYKGFYHQVFYQRKSLVCDIVEPFRCIIDRSLLKAIILKQFSKKDFKVKNGGYYLKSSAGEKYTKIFFENIMARKEDIFRYIQSEYRNTIKGENNFPKFFI